MTLPTRGTNLDATSTTLASKFCRLWLAGTIQDLILANSILQDTYLF